MVVWKDASGVYHAEKRTGILFSGDDILEVIQQAMDSLTPGRTVKEHVRVVSSGTVTRTLDTGAGPAEGLRIPSYTILDIPATIQVESAGGVPGGESLNRRDGHPLSERRSG